jgi:integrase
MRVYKRGAVYWFELIYDGQRYQQSTRVKNQRVAGEIASAFHTALAKGDVGITQRKVARQFATAMENFLTWSNNEHMEHPRTALRYKTSSAALLRFFKKTPLDKITSDEVERFKTRRAGECTTVRSDKGRVKTNKRIRPATVNRELACLKALFNYAMKGETVLRNPVSAVKFLPEQNQQERVLTYKEQRLYLAEATPVLRDVAGLILETGMRPEEVYTLQRSNIELARGFIKVTRGKTPSARRRVELTAEAQRILRERLKTPAGPYVFPCETDADRPIPKVNNAHDRAVRDSKVAPFRLYDLRHTWATRAAEAGIDLVTLAAMLGHSRIQMVMRYAHPTQHHQFSAMEKLELHNAKQARREKQANKMTSTMHLYERSSVGKL